MKRVTHTAFNTPTRSIGRDVELTLALIQALGRNAAPNTGWLHKTIETIRHFIR